MSALEFAIMVEAEWSETRTASAPGLDLKTCQACERSLHWRHFRQTGGMNPRTGRRYGDHTCRDCRAKERIAAGGKTRHQRTNAAGGLWCNHCQRYRVRRHFKPHPSRPGTFMAYCLECTRRRDKIRKGRRLSDPTVYEADAKRKNTRRRRQRAAEYLERKDTVANAIKTMRLRGLTLTAIAELFGSPPASITEWSKRERLPTPNTVKRFVVLLRETSHLPTRSDPLSYSRCRPEGFDDLVRRVQPLMDDLPVRNRWKISL